MPQREGTLFLSDWALIDLSSRHHVYHVTGFLWALSARRILIVQISRTAAASPARSSRLVLPTGCGAQHSSSHSALQACGRRSAHGFSKLTGSPHGPSVGPYHFLPTAPGSIVFSFQLLPPWGFFRPQIRFRGGHWILQFLSNLYHTPDHAPDWPSSYFIAANASWEIDKVVSN